MSRDEFLEQWARYMASPQWECLTASVRARANHLCERCQGAPIDEVHHLTYRRRFRERLTDLQGLCNPCHAYCHRYKLGQPWLEDPIVRRAQTILEKRVCVAPLGFFIWGYVKGEAIIGPAPCLSCLDQKRQCPGIEAMKQRYPVTYLERMLDIVQYTRDALKDEMEAGGRASATITLFPIVSSEMYADTP